MKQFELIKGKVPTAIRTVVYGPEGIGKSTFVSGFPKPIFIDTEGGTKQLDVIRFPEPETWTDLLDMIDSVIAKPEMWRTLIIDTVDRAEDLLTDQLLAEGQVDSIEKYGGGYGKGYTAMAERFNKDLLRRLDRLIAEGVHVTMVAHAAMRKFESPEDPPYDRWEMKLSKKIAPLVKEWTDNLFFATYEQIVVKEGSKNKAKGKAKRIMHTCHATTYDAKNRFGLNDNLPLEFAPLTGIYSGAVPTVPEHTMLTVDSPHEGIVDDDSILEDPRDVLIRMLKENGVEQVKFEAWLVATHRLAPGGHYTALSGTTAQSMIENLDILLKQLKGDKE